MAEENNAGAFEVTQKIEPRQKILKNNIAILDEFKAKGGFGEVWVATRQNAFGILAERIVRGEDSPSWLGINDVPYEESDDPKPITDEKAVNRIYSAANKAWHEYSALAIRKFAEADELYKDILNLIDPLLVKESRIAVKILKTPSNENPSLEKRLIEESTKRFLKENRLLRKVQHENIVRRFGLVDDPNLGWCLLLEYLEGETLDDYLKRQEGRGMPLKMAAVKAREVASALQYLHSPKIGIIHRDIKPANIMLKGVDGKAIIMDFGIGKWMDEQQDQQLTLQGQRIGTPRYMAPEQVREKTVDEKTDMYALGTMLFEMVTGRFAYSGSTSTEVMNKIIEPKHPKYVIDFMPDISTEFKRLIEVARAKDPQDRWTDQQFLEELDKIISKELYSGAETRVRQDSTVLKFKLDKADKVRKKIVCEQVELETKLHYVNVQERITKTRKLLKENKYVEARSEAGSLSKEVLLLSDRYDPLKTELRELESEVEIATECYTVKTLLVDALNKMGNQDYVGLGDDLDLIEKQHLKKIPPEKEDIHKAYQDLCSEFGPFKLFVGMFKSVQATIDEVRNKYGGLSKAHGEKKPVDKAVILELLNKLGEAEIVLNDSIKQDKIGIQYDPALKNTGELKEVLEDLNRFYK